MPHESLLASPQPSFKNEDKPEWFHQKALQALSNGRDVPFEATLRVVEIEGSASPLLPPRQPRKHPVSRFMVVPAQMVDLINSSPEEYLETIETHIVLLLLLL